MRLQALTPQLAREVNATGNQCQLPERKAALIVDVVAGTPAAAAGLKTCDLITAIGQKAVKTPSEVQLAVEAAKVGEPLAVTIERDGQSQTLEVNPAELPQSPKRN